MSIALKSRGARAEFSQRGIDADPLKCELARPHGVSVHPKTGDLYIADSDNGRILRIERDKK